MVSVQEYKVKIDSIIDRLPREKVEELLDYAAYLNTRYVEQPKSAISKESLLLQQESLKRIWDHPEEDIYEL